MKSAGVLLVGTVELHTLAIGGATVIKSPHSATGLLASARLHVGWFTISQFYLANVEPGRMMKKVQSKGDLDLRLIESLRKGSG